MPKYYSTPKYVSIDLFGKVDVGKTTIFELFAGTRLLKDGGNLSYDFRTYYAKCWVLQQRWEHTMVFLADPKLEMRWKDLRAKQLRKLMEPTNILILVTDSTLEDVRSIKQSFEMWPKIKKKLIIFVIANMQDKEGRLSVEEIKQFLEMKDVIGISAIQPGAKEKVEQFIEDATLRFFGMLAKRGQALLLYDDDEIGFGKTPKEKKSKNGKYSSRIRKLQKKLDES
ncbi:hypothetical protein NEF87_003833 [Candidatus Lokiarchaeum ossiferum]|uniref:Uncharacterized protein n=1 Tax=Candidatus Lokiarchaeum ossiferum TaxID=2951803 RepID=A0ABY6HVJ8_9ARCH|nr:hypothetical protein NEF87_003833 [Candidatus Lokiarchaeum sp. B-35]